MDTQGHGLSFFKPRCVVLYTCITTHIAKARCQYTCSSFHAMSDVKGIISDNVLRDMR